MIVTTRIDERLIHGQVAYSWTNQYPADAILVVDEEASKDNFQKSLLEMATPSGMRCFVLATDKAVEFLKKYDKKKIFIVVKHPKPLLELQQNGIDFKEINVGGLYHVDGRKQVSKTVFLDDEMIEIFTELSKKGIKLEVRTSPSDKSMDLMHLLKEE